MTMLKRIDGLLLNKAYKLLAPFFVLSLLVGCNSENQELSDPFRYIEKTTPKHVLIEFSNEDEDTALAQTHFGLGMGFRNYYLREPQGAKLVEYFTLKGVTHFDDISSIVFRSLHRKMNSKPINLEEQLDVIYAYENTIKECNSRTIKRAQGYDQKYTIGDTINIMVPFDRKFMCGVYYLCPNAYDKYDSNNDVIIKGIVIDKIDLNDSIPFYFNVQILWLNGKDIDIIGTTANIGAKMLFDLKHCLIVDGSAKIEGFVWHPDSLSL